MSMPRGVQWGKVVDDARLCQASCIVAQLAGWMAHAACRFGAWEPAGVPAFRVRGVSPRRPWKVLLHPGCEI